VHSEYNGSRNEPVHFLQIWLTPREHGLTPSYEQMTLTEDAKRGKFALVASPDGDAMTIRQNVRVLAGQPEPGKPLDYEIRKGRGAWVHLIRGAASVNGHNLTAGDAAAVTDETSLTIEGHAPGAELLLFDLE
jgi:redox-sensitive bicupin YhaK (pirin superfamily)